MSSFTRVQALVGGPWLIAPAVASCLSRCERTAAASRACRRRCSSVASGAKGGSEALLAWVAAEHRKDVARILEQAQRAAQRWEVAYTPFLSPPLAADALAALAQLPDVVGVAWGGYPQAERVRVAMGREDVMLEAQQDASQLADAVAALDCRGNFMFDPATHRDFLGALLGTGVVRDRVGDILIQGEGGAQLIVDPELVEHFEATLTQVRTVPVQTRLVPLSELRVPPPRREDISSIEASLRLDAVASAGFRMSRSKMSDLVKGGSVRVNWRPASKASVEVKEGDVISVTGKGRLELVSVATTKKDKFAVKMVRYV